MSTRRAIVATYKSLDQARMAIMEILAKGLANNQVSVVIRQRAMNKMEIAGELVSFPKSLPGFEGMLVEAGPISLPDLGKVVAEGPLAGALIQGDKDLPTALTYYGVSRERAQHYLSRVREGDALVLIETNNEYVNQAANILEGYGGRDVEKWSKATDKPLYPHQ